MLYKSQSALNYHFFVRDSKVDLMLQLKKVILCYRFSFRFDTFWNEGKKKFEIISMQKLHFLFHLDAADTILLSSFDSNIYNISYYLCSTYQFPIYSNHQKDL